MNENMETRNSRRQTDLKLHVVPEGAHDLHDLLRQFASGREHQSLALGQLYVDLLEDRHGESSRFTRT